MPVSMRASRAGEERAFTIVEVLVAALVVTAVFAGAIYFISGAGKTQQKTMVRQRMSSAADAITQKVRADRSWLDARPACARVECDLSTRFQPPAGSARGPRLTSTVIVEPVDGEGDGIGNADEDHVRPDYYRIEVRVELPAAEQATWGKQAAFETVSTIDATALGRAAGSLVVQVAETTNQVDERMAIADARASADQVPMRKQPDPCTSPFPVSWPEWTSARRPMLPLGCNDAFDAAESKSAFMTSVNVRGVTNVPFTIRRDGSDGGPTTTRTSADAESVASNGTYVFSGLPAGSYTITATPGPGRELWRTKMVPSDGRTSVQANQEARSLVMVRPVQGTGRYDVRITRDVFLYHLTTTTSTFTDTWTEHGATFRTVTTFRYLIGAGPRMERWGGPAWDGLIAMEPKPFDRFRTDDRAKQQTIYTAWDGRDTNGIFSFVNLPTGLQSAPHQQPAPSPVPTGRWGSLGARSMDCFPARTPGGSCGNFAWIEHRRGGSFGEPNSIVEWHSRDGECYLESNVSGYSFPRTIQLGPTHADRCSRDFIYRNQDTGRTTRIPNFLPRKDGTDGKRMVLSQSSVTTCIADCGISPPAAASYNAPAPEPSSTGARPSVAPASNPQPPSTPAPKPNLTIVRPTSTPGVSQSFSTSAAPMVPAVSTASD